MSEPTLDVDRVQVALEDFLSMADYDTHKLLKYGEDDEDVDQYPDYARKFVQKYYGESATKTAFTPCEHGNKFGECVLVLGHEEIRSVVAGGHELVAPMHVDRFGHTWNVATGS